MSTEQEQKAVMAQATAAAFNAAKKVMDKENNPLENVTHRPTPLPNPKATEQFFLVRIGEEYVCDPDGRFITPYFKNAYCFKDEDRARQLARFNGGQVYLRNKNHITAKRLMADYSPLY